MTSLPKQLCCSVALLFTSLCLFGPCFVGSLSGQEQATKKTEDGSTPTVVLVVGASGEEKYEKLFSTWAKRWVESAKKAKAPLRTVGMSRDSEKPDRELLREILREEAAKETPAAMWLVLIGHGTYDRKFAKFNLQGPDVAATEIGQWLVGTQRPIAIVNTTSSSGPFIDRLSGRNRVVITATKSGLEYNFARFGEFLSLAMEGIAADLDKDEQVSLLEAYIFAAGNVAQYYRENNQLSTEHALIDDNGDKKGTPADWFRGVIAIKKASGTSAVDGLRANQFHLIPSEREARMSPESRKRRDEIEVQLAKLRESRKRLTEDEYFAKLEPLLVEMAQLYAGTRSAPEPKTK